MKLSEIHFLNGQQNKKRVGVTGLVAQQGILNTDASRLNHLLAEIDSNIDIRSNLIILNYPMGNVSAKLMLPYTSMAVAQSSIEVEKLYSYIGLVDGTVVTMDHTDANSILRRSRTLMQQAAQARLAPASHLCTRESDRGASSLGAIKPKTDSKTLRIPLVSDACGLVQQTGKNSWAIAENWWQDFGLSNSHQDDSHPCCTPIDENSTRRLGGMHFQAFTRAIFSLSGNSEWSRAFRIRIQIDLQMQCLSALRQILDFCSEGIHAFPEAAQCNAS